MYKYFFLYNSDSEQVKDFDKWLVSSYQILKKRFEYVNLNI